MNKRTAGSYSRRGNVDMCKIRTVCDKMINANNNAYIRLGYDKQDEILSGKKTQIYHCALKPGDNAIGENPPQTSSQHQIKRYSRTLSETNVHCITAGNAKLTRVMSTTELRTRLAGCPKGLLIATEPPKSGETYRRRSNADTKAVPWKEHRTSPKVQLPSDGNYLENTDFQEEKETMLLHELETAKREREKLQKENERLQEELENRNKVIDHLIDFMKTNLPGEALRLGDTVNDNSTDNNLNRTQSFDKV